MISIDMLQNTHQQVKAKILERMGEWAEMFSREPDFGIMEQAYMKLKTQSTPVYEILHSYELRRSHKQIPIYIRRQNLQNAKSQTWTDIRRKKNSKWLLRFQ